METTDIKPRKRFELTLIDYGDGDMVIELKDFILNRKSHMTAEELRDAPPGSFGFDLKETLTIFKQGFRKAIIIKNKQSNSHGND